MKQENLSQQPDSKNSGQIENQNQEQLSNLSENNTNNKITSQQGNNSDTNNDITNNNNNNDTFDVQQNNSNKQQIVDEKYFDEAKNISNDEQFQSVSELQQMFDEFGQQQKQSKEEQELQVSSDQQRIQFQFQNSESDISGNSSANNNNFNQKTNYLNIAPSVSPLSNQFTEDFENGDKSDKNSKSSKSKQEEVQDSDSETDSIDEELEGELQQTDFEGQPQSQKQYTYKGSQNSEVFEYTLPSDHFDAQFFIEQKLGCQLESYSDGDYRILCPFCHGGQSQEVSFGVTVQDQGMKVLWNCFRAKCGAKGGVSAIKREPGNRYQRQLQLMNPIKDKKFSKPNQSDLNDLGDEFKLFFENRKISENTLQRNNISMKHNVKNPKNNQVVDAIAFPYYKFNKEGKMELVNIKYRTIDKDFWQEKDAMPLVYGYTDAVEGIFEGDDGQMEFVYKDEIYIVEGEMDKLAMEEAGFTNVVSVPGGAPSQTTPKEKSKFSSKYDFMYESSDIFKNASKVIMAVDNDMPGFCLMEDLSNRIGRGKCFAVKFPDDRDSHPIGDQLPEGDEGHRKDANEVLMKDGPEVLQQIITNAFELPLKGVLRFKDYAEEIFRLYLGLSATANPQSTGWTGLDNYYKVIPGELTVVTGVPNSGKSEWLDALAVNLSETQGWIFGLASMEKSVAVHGQQLIEKYIKKPFHLRNDTTEYINEQELIIGLNYIDHHFKLIRSDDELVPSIDWLLEEARNAHLRYGLNGLIIDPYNELDHQRDFKTSETDYISRLLSKIKIFCKTTGVHVWLVAHPRQQYQWRGECPTLYEISGSAHFINKMDCGVVVHRYPQQRHNENKVKQPQNDEFMKLLQEDDRNVLIRVMKVRNKYAGKQGDYILRYNRQNGTYEDAYLDKFYQQQSEYRFSDAVKYSGGDTDQDIQAHENTEEIHMENFKDQENFNDDGQNYKLNNSQYSEQDNQEISIGGIQNENYNLKQKNNQVQVIQQSDVNLDSLSDKQEGNFGVKDQEFIKTSQGIVDNDQIRKDFGVGDENENVDFNQPDVMDQQDTFDSEYNMKRE